MSTGGCFCKTMVTLGVVALGMMTVSACAPHKIPSIEYSEPSGRDIYMAECARCHGEDAKGNPAEAVGPSEARTDLTGLSKRNGGKFPADEVRAIVGGLEDIPAHHGPDPMPVWGDIFWARRNSARQNVNEGLDRLIDYLTSIQQ